MKISNNLTELVGNTPLLYLAQYSRKVGAENAKLIAKLEYFNPLGSVKDRAALAMIEDAEKSGKLKADSVIIEPTSGNTGIGLAFVATARGYRTILTMRKNWLPKLQIRLFPVNLPILQIQGSIRKPQRRRFGEIRTDRLTSLSPASAQAER